MHCIGKSRRTGKPCHGQAITGRNYCRMHGGKAPRGAALPQFKHGRYSKDLPTRLLAHYELARTDPKLLELKEEIALVQARVVDLIKRVDTGESGHLWQQLSKAFADLTEAIQARDTEAIRDSLTVMQSLIQRGTSDYQTWEEAGKQIDRQQRLVESERRRAVELQQVITMEQFLLYTSVYTDAIRTIITDRTQLAQLQSLLAARFRERHVTLDLELAAPTPGPDE